MLQYQENDTKYGLMMRFFILSITVKNLNGMVNKNISKNMDHGMEKLTIMSKDRNYLPHISFCLKNLTKTYSLHTLF